MQLTNEQLEILEAVKRGEEFIKINAFAGTGKTTTLLEVAKANPNRSILYLAFNKAIQMEAREKFPKNVEVKTTHALAYQKIVPRYNYKVRNNYKSSEIADFLGIEFEEASEALKVFELYCNSSILKFSSLSEYIDSQILSNAREIYRMMSDKKIDVTHSFYLKEFQRHLVYDKLKMKHYDIVLLDEAQDTNDVTISIFENIPASQRIIVGDKHQQIYSFRGSTNAMDKMAKDSKNYYLTNSFRFNQDIANKATNILKLFKNEIKELKGLGNKADIENKCYISRTNAKLILKMKGLIEEKKEFKTIREPYEIFGLALNILKLTKNEPLDMRFRYLEKMVNSSKTALEDLEEKAEKAQDIELLSAIGIVSLLWDEIVNIYKIAKEYYYENNDAHIFLTTAHTSKGLEWDEVELLNDFPGVYTIARWYKEIEPRKPKDIIDFISLFKNALKEGKVAQKYIDEFNLYYVAVTRARVVLIDNTNLKELNKNKLNEMIFWALIDI
jgi:superfamily I DNA/RNA helicase